MARNVALTIGVNHYQLDDLRDLQFAENDAIAMQNYLQDIGFEEVLRYSDQSQHQHPELVNLRRGLRSISSKVRLGRNDSFWLFFSGHGGRQQGRDFLLPTNADPEDLIHSAIAVDEVVRALRECKAGNLVLVLDACRNVVSDYGKDIGSQTVELVRQAGIITLFSCSPGQKSYELEEHQHGAFTYALLDALRGDCVPSQCSARKLSAYLQKTVPTLTQKFGNQRPYVIAEPVEKATQLLLPVSQDQKAPKPALPPSTVNVDKLKADALHAQYVLQDLGSAKNLWEQIILSSESSAEDKALALKQRLAIETQQKPSDPPAATSAPTPPQPIRFPQGQAIAPFSPVAKAPTPAPTISSPKPQPPTQLSPVAKAPTPPPPISSPKPQPTAQSPLLTVPFETVRVNDKGKIIEKISKEAQYFTEDLGNGITFDMVHIKGGSFDMGSNEYDSEKPIHRVTVPSFYMGKVVVTQAVYEAVMGENPSGFKGSDRPVEQVSWDDAIAFLEGLNKLSPLGQNYRLPSEAEWEYACRAGTTTPFHFGPTLTTAIANYDANYTYGNGPEGEYRKKTMPVGSFPPNAFGLYDMHGNVWEWCEDRWHDNYDNAPKDGSAWTTGESTRRLLRGGSWVNYPWYCRSANRNRNDAVDWDDVIGFRLVCSSPRT
ncbi:MAG: SUMF1/EgtB/PvdO family nonheme iron enzyme [Cyanobacteria bacterium P01_F01_bin.150]